MRAYSFLFCRTTVPPSTPHVSSLTSLSASAVPGSESSDALSAGASGPKVLTAPSPARRVRPHFSFLADPHEPRDVSLSPLSSLSSSSLAAVAEDAVPNSAPVPLLPAWASSLTSPRMRQQRHVVENWIAPDVLNVLPEADVDAFRDWLRARIGDDAADTLDRHVQFYLRARFARGVLARRPFSRGDVIFSIPLSADFSAVIDAASLERRSAAARRRRAPPFSYFSSVLSRRVTSFDPTPHALFAEQFYAAALLSCERSAGAESPLWPFLRLLAPVDDDFVCALHRAALEPAALLDFRDHCRRGDDCLRRARAEWPDAPPLADMRWALRVVLARQRMLPLRTGTRKIRGKGGKEKNDREEEEGEDEWAEGSGMVEERRHAAASSDARGGNRTGRWRITDMFDVQRTERNAFDPRIAPCLVPPLCMLEHPPGGIANAAIRVNDADITVVATDEIEEAEAITVNFTRCYSVPYTLYRFGFLPLRRREDDAAEDLRNAIGPDLQ